MLKYITLCLTAFITTVAVAQVDPVFSSSGHYGQFSISYNLDKNIFYKATSRFRVSSTIDNNNTPKLFDGNYDQEAITVAANGNTTITIDLKAKSGKSLENPEGFLYINFYDLNDCDSLYTRIYDTTGDYADWNFSDWENVSTNAPFIRLRLPIHWWVTNAAKIEIKAFAKSTDALKITEIEYYQENGGQFEGGLVTKLGANTLYDTLKFADTSGAVKGFINANGFAVLDKLGIGCNNINDDSSKLSVKGRVRANEVKVDVDAWPDYVFDNKYNLLPLKDVQSFIRDNGHLPGIPSADEVAKKGLELGKGQAALLQKLEELTLYILEQQNEIDQLRNEVKCMKAAAKQ